MAHAEKTRQALGEEGKALGQRSLEVIRRYESLQRTVREDLSYLPAQKTPPSE
jgi:hypothetical protein